MRWGVAGGGAPAACGAAGAGAARGDPPKPWCACVSPAGAGGELKFSSRLIPGETKPLAAPAAVSSSPAGGGARCSARKAIAAPSVAGEMPWDALPPDGSIVVVVPCSVMSDGVCLVNDVKRQSDSRRRADPLVADDALSAVAAAQEELGRSRRNSRHRRSGIGDGHRQIC